MSGKKFKRLRRKAFLNGFNHKVKTARTVDGQTVVTTKEKIHYNVLKKAEQMKKETS